MNRALSRPQTESGFTLVEVLVAIVVTMIVMSAVFGLLVKGQL